MRYVRVNERIFAKTVRLIGPEGEQLGVFPRDMAIKKAKEIEQDLVEVAPAAQPPVCRLMDFSKYRYELDKRDREQKKHQKQGQIKEIRISPRIGIHDYEIKLKHAKEFLVKKNKVRVRMLFKGREMSHQDLGEKVIAKFLQDIQDVGRIDRDKHMLGKALLIVVAPK